MIALRNVLTVCVLSMGLAGPAAAQDEPSIEELERELVAIEEELASYYRVELELAIQANDRHAAGLALRAYRGHHAMAARTLHGALLDDALHARLALHARALAIEGRIPRELADDVRALDEERANVGESPSELERA